MAFLIAWCTSIIASQWQAKLISLAVLLVLFSLAVLLILLARFLPKKSFYCYGLSGFLLGLVYANGFAAWSLDKVLATELEQKEVEFQLVITDIPLDRGAFQRSRARVLSNELGKVQGVQLDWYGGEEINACDVWRVVAKLKRPHGLRNPGGWSFRQYALENHIHASGYVKSAEKLAESSACLQSFRARWQAYLLEQLAVEKAAWLIALSIGEKSALSVEQYQLLQAFGINHLFVISGLHIGLCASVVFTVFMLLRRLGLGLIWQGDWRLLASVFALLAAITYTALANFAIPAQRALLMLIVFFSASAVGLRLSTWLRFFMAMALVLLINPFAAMNLGFALSFAAVAILILCANEWRRKTVLGKFYLLVQSQFAITIGLSPFLLLYFSQVSLLAPWVNLLAIPYVSFIVVPLLLLALLLWALTGNDFGLLMLASGALQQLFRLLEFVQGQAGGLIELGQEWFLSLEALLLLGFICAVLLVLRRCVWHWQSVMLALLLMFTLPEQHKLQQGELHLAFIDVGQGLSILVRTENHHLLYDTGASWQKGSMAEQVVLPVLRYYGVRQLDRAVISHFHDDHAGGWRFLHRRYLVDDWLAPSSEKPFTRCQQGLSWHWDGVDFAMLGPESDFIGNENDSSCVLLIAVAGKHVLLTGDIGKQQEIRISLQKNFPNIDILQAAHHGSNTSSSYALISRMDRLQGKVIYSTGYRNSYRHPHPKVVERFAEYGIEQFNTATDGLIDVWIDAKGNVKLNAFRQQQQRYWDDVAVNHLEY